LSERVAEATLPAYVRLRDDPARAAGTLMLSLRYLLLAALLPLAVLAAVAPDFVDAVLGPRWVKMNPILTTLCVWGGICIVTGSLGWFLNANQGARFMARVNLFRLCFSMPLIFVAAAVWGSLELVAILLCVDITIELIPLAWYAHRRLHVPFSGLFAAVRLPLAAAAVAVVCTLATRIGLDHAGVSAWPTLIVASAVGLATYAATALMLDRNAVPELRGLVSRAVAR
jgi:PST family polysaccharide transporter/lipopolysaccharide exporter